MSKVKTGRFVWFEYVSKDLAKAQGFFGELFNWGKKEVSLPGGAYTMITAGTETIGGYMPTPAGAPAHSHWLSHLHVESARDTVAKINSLGGKTLKEPFKVGDFGVMAIVQDPFGGPFAVWEPLKDEAASSDYKGVENTFCWHELYTDEPAKSVEFYKAIGGFEEERMALPDGGTYHILKSDGKGRAGIMKSSMPGIPQTWMPYIQVKNCDATVEKAQRLGASIKMAGEDVKDVGRLAIFTDPQGAPLGILQPAATMKK